MTRRPSRSETSAGWEEIMNPRSQVEQQGFYMRAALLREMVDYCRRHLPYEGCGLISGIEQTGLTLWKLRNETRSISGFSMSEQAVAMALKLMRQKGEQLTGIFHSHPTTSAYPTRKDIKFNPYPNIAYLIVSFNTQPPEIGCFQMDSLKQKVERRRIYIFDS